MCTLKQIAVTKFHGCDFFNEKFVQKFARNGNKIQSYNVKPKKPIINANFK